MRSTGADLGIAHDGDADRCLAVDATGAVVDGDQLLAICALALRDRGQLRDDTVVATVMSNLGFHHAMRDAGIEVLTTAVGDRYVLEALRAKDLSLGGEQSGHIVFTDSPPPATACSPRCRSWPAWPRPAPSLAELAAVVHRLPQTLVNVPVADRDAVARVVERGRPRSPTPRPSSATTGGCCCGRPAPSSSSGSWSRPRPRSRPTRSPNRLAAVVGRRLSRPAGRTG